ncbi:hypothetical protein CXQ85_004482 [Candidozyma haemuli]|uniref:Phospholipid/glycerol acyltransferase domain-containing protein n=1 Tax=Candidozyma haemuli TaxID=45357 RepID=A0A2V1ATX4_9ASCO|nr:hypothetical protein CXQ85_004482 [[Candida] haemuloni]PVH20966.1 hypothetical protein CXQ85_004482 [[Candida] haemuloni]
MELLTHLGILVAPNPTFESALYKARGYITMWFLFNLCTWYHSISLVMSVTGICFPELAEYTKRMAGFVVWEVLIFFSELNRVSVEVKGDEIDPFSAVFMANHQSLADYIALAAVAHKFRKGENGAIPWESVPQVNFFTWFTLARAPTVKALFNMTRCDENWELAQSQSDRMFKRVRDSNAPEWVVLFPEVNIWTSETSYLQSIQAHKYFLPEMRSVLYPRFSNFSNAIWSLRGEKVTRKAARFSTLYDVSIVHNKPVTLLEYFSCKEPHVVTIHVKKKSLDKIPLRKPKMEKWLEKTWVEKNKLVGSLTRLASSE